MEIWIALIRFQFSSTKLNITENWILPNFWASDVVHEIWILDNEWWIFHLTENFYYLLLESIANCLKPQSHSMFATDKPRLQIEMNIPSSILNN